MSNSVTEPKSVSLGMLKSSYRLFSKDLEFLPEDAFNRSFGPKCRTVADLVYEVILLNDHVGLTMRGEELFPWPDGWIKAPPDYRTKSACVARFKGCMDRFIATVEGFSDEEMLAPIDDDDGEQTTRFERCRFVALHNWYHSGQLNFIQTLLGDDAFHW